MHYKITWMGNNGKYYEKSGLTIEEVRKFIKKKGWENENSSWGPEIECEEDPLWIKTPYSVIHSRGI